jgi:hypothetical protein
LSSSSHKLFTVCAACNVISRVKYVLYIYIGSLLLLLLILLLLLLLF